MIVQAKYVTKHVPQKTQHVVCAKLNIGPHETDEYETQVENHWGDKIAFIYVSETRFAVMDIQLSDNVSLLCAQNVLDWVRNMLSAAGHLSEISLSSVDIPEGYKDLWESSWLPPSALSVNDKTIIVDMELTNQTQHNVIPVLKMGDMIFLKGGLRYSLMNPYAVTTLALAPGNTVVLKVAFLPNDIRSSLNIWREGDGDSLHATITADLQLQFV
jgi:hypothetical protein